MKISIIESKLWLVEWTFHLLKFVINLKLTLFCSSSASSWAYSINDLLYSVQAEASSGNNHLLHFRFQHSDHLFSCIQLRRIRRNCYSSNSISLYSLDNSFRFMQCCLSMIIQTFSLPFFSHIFIQTSLINQ